LERSDHMVFYRKYRPQKILELDSEAVRNSLYSIFSKKDTAHAFLFAGPKGLGKTSAARIIAKVINCEKHKQNSKFKIQNSKDIEPDNKCAQCISITNGTNLDVLEIDGASNRGIDEIRDLKEKINLLPAKATKKIYIIDEVHMLTTEAFNALLKTLEEPPNHAVFILCTTELHKLPQTIISRCFRIDFKKATDEEIARSLLRIVKSEEIKIEKDVLYEIAKMSDGGFREAAKILEELFLRAGRKIITKKFLEENYNILGIDKNLDEFIKALLQKDTKKGFEISVYLGKQGADFKFFIEKLIDRFHLMLLGKLGIVSEETDFQTAEIKKILELLAKAHMETKYSVLPQLPLELVLVEWAENGLISQQPHLSDDTRQDLSLNKSGSRSLNESLSIGSDKKPHITVTTFDSSESGLSPAHSKNNKNQFYATFIEEVKNHNHLIAGVLRSCEIDISKSNILEIYALSKFHKEKLEEEKSMLILKETANKLLDKKVKVSVVLKE